MEGVKSCGDNTPTGCALGLNWLPRAETRGSLVTTISSSELACFAGLLRIRMQLRSASRNHRPPGVLDEPAASSMGRRWLAFVSYLPFVYINSSQPALEQRGLPSLRSLSWAAHVSGDADSSFFWMGVMGLRRHGALGPSALSRPAWKASASLGPSPLSAQARTLYDLPTHQLPILSGFGPTHIQPTDPLGPAGRSLLQQS